MGFMVILVKVNTNEEGQFEILRNFDRSFLSHQQFGLPLPANNYNKV